MTCALASKDCAGRLEWHHVIKQQRLRREFKYGAFEIPTWQLTAASEQVWSPAHRYADPDLSLDSILGDTRNRIFLCSHHHELVTNGRVKVELPDSVWEFAREFGLEGMLENDLRRAA